MTETTTAADRVKAAGPDPRAVSAVSRRRRGADLFARFNLVLVFLALCAVATVLAPEFLTTRNMSNLLQQSALTGIVAVGMTMVILTAGIDLSVGSVAAFGGMTVAMLIDGDVNFLLAIAGSLAVGAAFGAVMGGLSAYLSLPSFMTTLAGLTAIRGLTYLLTDGKPTGGDIPKAFQLLGGGFIGVVPIVGIVFLAVTVVAALVLRGTTFGEYVYAVGSNKEAARLSGLPVRGVITAVFAISGALSALAGVLLTSRLTIGQPTAFSGLELDAIAAVVLGGTNLFGGRGGVGGTFVAVLLLSVLRNLCNLMGLGSFFPMVVTGLILVVALILNMVIEKRGSVPDTATRPVASAPAAHTVPSAIGTSNTALRAYLHGLPGVDEVGARARAADLATRSIKTTAKAQAVDLAISMIDLTTLEGADTRGKVRALCAKAMRPDPADRSVPSVAAVCVYPDLVATAVEALGGSGVGVASVATAFPSGRAPLEAKLLDTAGAVADGAGEIDMVIDRGAFLAGDYRKVYEEIAAVKEVCARPGGPVAHLKVILETGELVTYDNVRRASWLAMHAGADFIKTSTGKVSPAATPPVTMIMLEAVRDFHAATGRRVGVKPAGGIRTAKDAVRLLVMVNETAGQDWLSPDWFRIGASSVLNDLLMQRTRLTTGTYPGPDYYTVD